MNLYMCSCTHSLTLSTPVKYTLSINLIFVIIINCMLSFDPAEQSSYAQRSAIV